MIKQLRYVLNDDPKNSTFRERLYVLIRQSTTYSIHDLSHDSIYRPVWNSLFVSVLDSINHSIEKEV